MYRPLPTPKEMAQWDRYTIEEFGILGEILMENASRNIFYVLKKYFPSLKGKKVLIFAGSGNNGGDGFALARHLLNQGAECKILHTKEFSHYKKETAYHLSLLRKLDVEFSLISNTDLSKLETPDIIIDGLLGTGFEGSLREDYLSLVRFINSFKGKSFILAIDIPSGLNGYTGKPSPEAIKADCTVTFEEAKIGLYMPEARDYVGDLYVCSIGIPEFVKKSNPPKHFLITLEAFKSIPSIDDLSHKGKAGHVLIIGGSPGLTGATTLAALGALRAGAGLVTVATLKELAVEIKQGWPEIMTLPLKHKEGWSKETFYELEDHLERFDSVVLGPGIGREKGVLEFIKIYITKTSLPTVYDADALFAIAQDKALLKELTNCVLTPHPGEMARILGTSNVEVQKDRISAVRKCADELKDGVAILKGACSLVAKSKGPLFLCPVCCSNLAIGGSGDVLAGIIGALLARGMSLVDSACVGVLWHAMAGEVLKELYPKRGNLAQEIAHLLPKVLDRGQKGELPFYGTFS